MGKISFQGTAIDIVIVFMRPKYGEGLRHVLDQDLEQSSSALKIKQEAFKTFHDPCTIELET